MLSSCENDEMNVLKDLKTERTDQDLYAKFKAPAKSFSAIRLNMKGCLDLGCSGGDNFMQIYVKDAIILNNTHTI